MVSDVLPHVDKAAVAVGVTLIAAWHQRVARHHGLGPIAKREQLLRIEPLADVALGGLELSRTVDDPFGRLAADELAGPP